MTKNAITVVIVLDSMREGNRTAGAATQTAHGKVRTMRKLLGHRKRKVTRIKWLAPRKLERVYKRLEKVATKYGFDEKTARQLARI